MLQSLGFRAPQHENRRTITPGSGTAGELHDEVDSRKAVNHVQALGDVRMPPAGIAACLQKAGRPDLLDIDATMQLPSNDHHHHHRRHYHHQHHRVQNPDHTHNVLHDHQK